MDLTGLIPHIEALIFASDKPLPVLEITDLLNNAFGFMEDKVSLDQVEAAMEGIVEKYNADFYPFEVVQSGGGWQFLTKKEFHKTVAQLNGEKFMKRLSAAALETLAIIAYKQPVTKGEIEAIRGVSADYAVQKLLEKDLIIISGRNEKMPGHPLVYATSKSFMDYFGINSSDDLPKIKEVLSEHLVAPTLVKEKVGEEVEEKTEADVEVEGRAEVEMKGEVEEAVEAEENMGEFQTQESEQHRKETDTSDDQGPEEEQGADRPLQDNPNPEAGAAQDTIEKEPPEGADQPAWVSGTEEEDANGENEHRNQE